MGREGPFPVPPFSFRLGDMQITELEREEPPSWGWPSNKIKGGSVSVASRGMEAILYLIL